MNIKQCEYFHLCNILLSPFSEAPRLHHFDKKTKKPTNPQIVFMGKNNFNHLSLILLICLQKLSVFTKCRTQTTDNPTTELSQKKGKQVKGSHKQFLLSRTRYFICILS